MPTISNITQIENAAHYAAWGDCIRFEFDAGDSVISAGLEAHIEFLVNASSQANGITFQIAGQTFITDNSVIYNTASSVNLSTGSALDKAERIRAMLLSCPAFYGKIDVSVTTSPPTSATVRIDWKNRGNISPFLNSFSLLSPAYTIVSSNAGIDISTKKCYQVGFELWERTNTGVVQLTSLQKVTPTLDSSGLPVLAPLEINDMVRPFLYSSFPLVPSIWNNMFVDQGIRRRFFLRYGVISCNTGGVMFREPFLIGPEVRVINAALPSGDLDRLLYINEATERKALTERPNWNICWNDADWVWLLIDDVDINDQPINFRLRTYWRASAAGAWTLISGSELTTVSQAGGAVYRIPTGITNNYNSVSIPSNAWQYRVSVFNGFNNSLITEFIYDIMRPDSCGCGEDSIVFYFLNKYGAFDPIRFCSVTEHEVVGDQDFICQRAVCVPPMPETFGSPNDKQFYDADRLKSGNLRVIKSGIYRQFTAETEALTDSEGIRDFIESFLLSPVKYAIYKGYHREVYVSPDVRVLKDEDGGKKFSITFFYEKEKEVQI